MTDDHLIREVEEEIRREQLKKLWDRYGIIVIAVAVLVVAGTAGYRGWEVWQDRRSAAAGDTFMAAIDAANDDRLEEAGSLLDEVEAAGVGTYDVLARMREAGLDAEAGDIEAAVAGYEAVAADGSADRALRDVATLRAAYLLVDTASYDDIRGRVESYTAPDNAWRHFAREILGLAAYRDGNLGTARDWFQALSGDPQVPANARARAEVMLALLGAPDTAAAPAAAASTETN